MVWIITSGLVGPLLVFGLARYLTAVVVVGVGDFFYLLLGHSRIVCSFLALGLPRLRESSLHSMLCGLLGRLPAHLRRMVHLTQVAQGLHICSAECARGLVVRHGCVGHGGQLRLQLLAVLLEVDILDGGIAKAGAIGQRMEALLLWREILRGREEVGDFLDAFGEIELRLLAQRVAVGFGPVGVLGVDVEERIVLLEGSCIGLACRT